MIYLYVPEIASFPFAGDNSTHPFSCDFGPKNSTWAFELSRKKCKMETIMCVREYSPVMDTYIVFARIRYKLKLDQVYQLRKFFQTKEGNQTHSLTESHLERNTYTVIWLSNPNCWIPSSKALARLFERTNLWMFRASNRTDDGAAGVGVFVVEVAIA